MDPQLPMLYQILVTLLLGHHYSFTAYVIADTSGDRQCYNFDGQTIFWSHACVHIFRFDLLVLCPVGGQEL